MGAACLGPLFSRKSRGFDVCTRECMGLNASGHAPCPRMPLLGYGAASCGAVSAQALVRRRGRDSPQSAFSYLRESILFRIIKEQRLFSSFAEKIVMGVQARGKLQDSKVYLEEER